MFAPLFDAVIEDYHKGFKPTDKHPPSKWIHLFEEVQKSISCTNLKIFCLGNWGNLDELVNVDPENKYVVSTRVRCGRSLQGYPFNPCLNEAVSFFIVFLNLKKNQILIYLSS